MGTPISRGNQSSFMGLLMQHKVHFMEKNIKKRSFPLRRSTFEGNSDWKHHPNDNQTSIPQAVNLSLDDKENSEICETIYIDGIVFETSQLILSNHSCAFFRSPRHIMWQIPYFFDDSIYWSFTSQAKMSEGLFWTTCRKLHLVAIITITLYILTKVKYWRNKHSLWRNI